MLGKEQFILIHSIKSEDFLGSIQELKQEIVELKSMIISQPTPAKTEEILLMTRNEVAQFFKVNISTVRNWSKSGILQPYYCGDRVYFKRSEVIIALTPSNITVK